MQKVLSGECDYSRVIQIRVKLLVGNIEHAARIKARTRLERSKNELRSLVKVYGIQIMRESFNDYGFSINTIDARKSFLTMP